jgi:cysteinyl-tRNA synthetase
MSEAFAVVAEVVKSGEKPEDILATVLDFDSVLGLKLAEGMEQSLPEEVKGLLDKREKARKDGDYAQADRLRDELSSMGYTVSDTADGQKISKNL